MAAEILGPAVVRGMSAATKSNGQLIGSSHLARFPLAMNLPSPALSILVSPSNDTSVDPDIWSMI
jgi:hypothetical protein